MVRRWEDELLLRNGWPMTDVKPYFHPGPMSQILNVANLSHAASRIWTYAELDFRLYWMKLCSRCKVVVITTPQRHGLTYFVSILLCFSILFGILQVLLQSTGDKIKKTFLTCAKSTLSSLSKWYVSSNLKMATLRSCWYHSSGVFNSKLQHCSNVLTYVLNKLSLKR